MLECLDTPSRAMNERQCGYQDRFSEGKRGYTATPHKTIGDILRYFGHAVFKNGTKKSGLEANVGRGGNRGFKVSRGGYRSVFPVLE